MAGEADGAWQLGGPLKAGERHGVGVQEGLRGGAQKKSPGGEGVW